MNTPPDARQGDDAISHPDPVDALVISHVEMNAACGSGQAVPLGRAIPWIARYGGSWWVECERGWLRVTDDLTAADLDQTAARLKAAEAMAAVARESAERLDRYPDRRLDTY
jgi:hypothetical protein